jgi:hypothetical protein
MVIDKLEYQNISKEVIAEWVSFIEYIYVYKIILFIKKMIIIC